MIDVFEWTAAIVNAAGLMFIALVIRELWRDRAASDPVVLATLGITNGRRRMWVYILLRHESVFLFFQGIFLWASIASLRRANPTDPAADDILFISLAIFIVLALVMDIATLLDIRDRSRIRRYVSK